MADFRGGGTLSGGLYAAINPYPLARTERNALIPTNSSVPAPANVPRTFNWSGHVRNAGANLHAVISSRRLVGPAFIDEIEILGSLGAGSGNSPKAIFGYSLSQIADANDVADAALAQVIPFFEQSFRDDGGFTAAGLAGIYQTVTTTTPPRNIRLKRVISASEFFLVAAVRDDGAAGAFIVDFTLRVLENVDPDLLGELVIG